MILTWISTLISGILAYVRSGVLESPMYLYTVEDPRLKIVIADIATMNGKPDFKFSNPFLSADPHPKTKEKVPTMIDIFKKPYLSTTLIQTIQYFFSQLAYYGMIFFMPLLLPATSDLNAYIVIFIQQIGNF